MRQISPRTKGNVMLVFIGLIVIVIVLVWIFWQGACLAGRIC